jgi:hypothetical protein
MVGMPVPAFGVALVNDSPATCPRLLWLKYRAQFGTPCERIDPPALRESDDEATGIGAVGEAAVCTWKRTQVADEPVVPPERVANHAVGAKQFGAYADPAGRYPLRPPRRPVRSPSHLTRNEIEELNAFLVHSSEGGPMQRQWGNRDRPLSVVAGDLVSRERLHLIIPNREPLDREGFGGMEPHSVHGRGGSPPSLFERSWNRQRELSSRKEHVMPVLAFPCAIHRLDSNSRPTTRRVWVKGHDFRTLALAATEQLGSMPDGCRYSLISPDTKHGPTSALLEITPADGEDDADALLAPMGSPLPTESLLDRRFSLDELIALLGLEQPVSDAGPEDPGRVEEVKTAESNCASDRSCRQYQVIVTYSPICNWEPRPSTRQLRGVDIRYSQRIDAAERIWIDRARYQGI